MSHQRAVRRAQREALAAAAVARRDRQAARRARRRALARRLVPPRGRTGRLYTRRSTAERAAIVLATLLGLAAVWYWFDDLATRVALSALVLVASPALIVLTLDRRR